MYKSISQTTPDPAGHAAVSADKLTFEWTSAGRLNNQHISLFSLPVPSAATTNPGSGYLAAHVTLTVTGEIITNHLLRGRVSRRVQFKFK